MPIDISKAFELPGNNGLILSEGGASLVSDAGAPTHDAPIGSKYINLSTGREYWKYASGSGSDKWLLVTVFGSESQTSSDATETSTTSTTVYSTKLSLVTPATLPLGDYAIFARFKWRAGNANRAADFRVQMAGSDLFSWVGFVPSLAANPLEMGLDRVNGISGANTFTLDFKVNGAGTTIYVSEAKLFFWRIA